MENFNERFKRLRRATGLVQKDFARRAGVSQATISDIERGRNEGSDKIVELALALGVSPTYLKTGFDAKTPPNFGGSNVTELSTLYVKVPIISWVKAGMMEDVQDIFEPGFADNWIDVPKKRTTANSFALEVVGDSMTSPNDKYSFEEGDIIICDPDLAAKAGDFVIAKDVERQAATFKKLTFDGSRYYLKPLNPAYPAIEIDDPAVRVIARVVRRIKTDEL